MSKEPIYRIKIEVIGAEDEECKLGENLRGREIVAALSSFMTEEIVLLRFFITFPSLILPARLLGTAK